MKPNFEFVPNFNSSFHAYELRQPCFEFIWHYHPEYEITFVQSGRGKRLVGDNLEDFAGKDMILIGPNIPHAYTSEPTDDGIRALGIQFSADLFPRELLQKEEFVYVNALLSKNHAVAFPQSRLRNFERAIEGVIAAKGIDKFIRLSALLDRMGQVKHVRPLNHNVYHQEEVLTHEKGLGKALRYIHDNFQKQISIDAAALEVNMTKTSFCRFFKRKTGSTFTDYVNNLRIGIVCRDLLASDESISTIAFRNGYNSLSYFNRIFYRKKGMSPGDYRGMVFAPMLKEG